HGNADDRMAGTRRQPGDRANRCGGWKPIPTSLHGGHLEVRRPANHWLAPTRQQSSVRRDRSGGPQPVATSQQRVYLEVHWVIQCVSPPNQTLHLTGAAVLVSRGMKVLQRPRRVNCALAGKVCVGVEQPHFVAGG